MAYYGGNDTHGDDINPAQMILDACKQLALTGFDFAPYDTDNNGVIDNVFVYYAGFNEAEGSTSTPNANTIWPHRWSISGAGLTSGTYSGKTVEDYSCTSELRGSSGTTMCGVGTFCHEFGHVLGLPDYYDTSGITSNTTLETWEVMDYGPYLNDGCTPPSYSVWDRFFLGYLTPQQISSASDLTLQPLYLGTTQPANTDGQAYLFSATTHNMSATSPSPAEFFLVEYRKHTGWDKYLGQTASSIGTNSNIPSDGMCIWHIDYLQSAWDNNGPNNAASSTQTPSSHIRVYLQPLSGQTTTPGTTFTTGSFTPTTWSGTNLNRPITSIAMSTNYMTFKFMGGAPVFGTFSALPATNISTSSFTANWETATNATKYLLDVYKKTTTAGGTPTTVLSENFDKFTAGTTGAGASGTDVSSTLDTYTQTTGWTGSKVYQDGGTVKVGTSSALGYITTPSIDLSGNSGAFNLSFKAMAWSGDSTKLKIYLNNVLVKTLTGMSNDASYTLKPFSVDLTGGTSTSKIKFEGNQAAKGRFLMDSLVIYSGVGSSTTKTMILTNYEVATGTSINVTGLTPDTYYYTVKASNGTDISAESNEITVSITTDVTAPEENKTTLKSVVGGVNVIAPKDEIIRIFDITGSLVKEQHLSIGLNYIPLQGSRIYIVKIASFNTKIVVK